MEQPFEEVAAPLEMGAWNDEALLDAFERAVTTHGIDKKDKKTSQTKETNTKKKSTVIFKRNPVQEEEGDSDDGMEAVTCNQFEDQMPKEQNKSIPQPQPSQPAQPAQFSQPSYSIPQQPAKSSIPSMNPSSMLPSVPDQEEQEALSQLLLAWYQAGYAAGRYACIRQRKCSYVCQTNSYNEYDT